VLAAGLAVLFASAAWANGQRASGPPLRQAGGPAMRGGPRSQTAHPQITRRQPAGRQSQNLYIIQSQRRPQGNLAPNYARPALRPGNPGNAPGSVYTRPASPGTPYGSVARPANPYRQVAPPGHLEDWLNQHRGLPVQEQERMLQRDPSFYRLPPSDQQRLVRQLHQVNQMPEEQRDRRLARAEAIEHMSPQDRMNLNISGRRLGALPLDRQMMVKRAFRDLRSVPVDQRQMVLNSARYQGVFSPEERGILSDFLRVEPYEPAR